MFGLLTTVLCNGDDNDEVNGILEGGALLLLFLSPVLLVNSNGWPRGGLLPALLPVKLLENGVDDLLGVDNLLGVNDLLGAGGGETVLVVETLGLV